MTQHSLQKLVALLLVLFIGFPHAKAQSDAHYWTQQFGAKGLLLNGSVIASTEDETAVFYNPGAMGNGEDFGISLSFFTPQYSVLRTDDYLGAGTEVKDEGFGFASGLSAIGFRPFKDHRFRASITSFSRFRSNLNLNDREVGQVLNQQELLFIGNLDFKRRLSERWFGFGMAMKINENLSVGVSNFAAFHSESSELAVRKEIVNQANPNLVELGWRSFFRYSFSVKGALLSKLGVSANIGDLKLGFTVTTPMYYKPYKSAGYETDDLRTYGTDSTTLLSNQVSTDLMDYKTPWSVGLGLDFRIKRSRISFSTEYFEKIDRYVIIDNIDDPFDGLADGDNRQKTLVELENRPVLNAAVGLQTLLRDNQSTLIMGFRTDFNQRKIGENLQTINFLSTTPSAFHFSFGVLSTFRNNQFSLGLDYGFGRKRTTGRLVDLTNITPDNLFQFSESGGIASRYSSLVIVFTYDFILKSWKNRKQWREEQKGGNR